MGKTFKELYELDVKGYVGTLTKTYEDKKTGEEKSFDLSYIPWADALRIMYELDESATYEIREWDGRPYLDTGRGGLVHVTVTLFGRQRACFLPIMDAKYDPIEDFDAFDVNTALQRCIVKALAHHGVGLSLYKKDAGQRGGPKAPAMKAGAHGERVNMPVTVLAVKPMKDASMGAKLEVLTEAGEAAKVTAFTRRVGPLPVVGESVMLSGAWEISDKYGASITADRIAPNVTPDPEPTKTEPAQRHEQRVEPADAPPDTPTNRAAMSRKITALNERAAVCGVNPIDVKALVGKNTGELMSIGLAHKVAVEAAEQKQQPRGQARGEGNPLGFPV